mmetsp:Transcript_42701/g.96207  ORF Transcript_42701/g.96207 Transcript_42701/m.96207 type:complete len:468 (-) Transcript_42701:214-1617(-)|eukprot:CAMPEP_0204382490 /NCGR_PEP_ID=MMETSP0469-20131031/55150_1 /ASSEMBLY_ACC=CAM_ASM_000384 /TAXON_ID=2969 /ORGANISM="Oxyrrhis marina" /LENGTH=467 /DNA_ID=CAMNT_0051374577 /DNA_START=31 /DNA_END=1434 /DNA_ORIENTATION=-
MSEYFRKYIKRDVPPAANIKFRCAKLHRHTEGDQVILQHNTIYDVLKSRGWKEADMEQAPNDWSFFWADRDWIHDAFDRVHLDASQKVNHFRNHYELTRKDLLAKNLKRMRRQCERDNLMEEAQMYNCCPTTFSLPVEYNMFVEEFKKNQNSIWIMKPIGRSQGTGIFLINKLAQIQQWKPTQIDKKAEENEDGPVEQYVVQKYVEDPMLIGGKKFDIRLYVCVTSYQPLTVHVNRGGFCRFSMHKYSVERGDLNASLAKHLTNIAVQKHGKKEAYTRTGAKMDLSSLKSFILSKADVETVNKVMTAIEDIVIYSLLAVQKSMINDKHCFELYGYDVMIDKNFKPWLIEVNASPSLTANTPADYDFKFGLLDDTLTIIDLEKYLSGEEKQIGGFDLLYKDGQRVRPPPGSVYTSYMGGTAEVRKPQLKRLAKQRSMELMRGDKPAAKKDGGDAPGTEKSKKAPLFRP